MSARGEWLLAGGALALVLVVAYGNTFSNSFHYDDFHSLVDNPHVRTLDNWSAFFADPTTGDVPSPGFVELCAELPVGRL